MAPEVIALVQPNSSSSGLKNKPKVTAAPKAIAQMMKEAETTT